MIQKVLLSAYRCGVSWRLAAICAIALKFARLRVVHQINRLDRIPMVPFESRVLDWKERFDTPIETAIHQVGAPQVNLLDAAVGEVVDLAMLQESANDAPHPNRLAHTWSPRAQTTHATNDQVDLYTDL
jgi:hypothetical protein